MKSATAIFTGPDQNPQRFGPALDIVWEITPPVTVRHKAIVTAIVVSGASASNTVYVGDGDGNASTQCVGNGLFEGEHSFAQSDNAEIQIESTGAATVTVIYRVERI